MVAAFYSYFILIIYSVLFYSIPKFATTKISSAPRYVHLQGWSLKFI